MKEIPMSLKQCFGLLLVILLLGGGWLFFHEKKVLREEVETELTGIAHLKVNQIVQWRAERLGGATTIAENPFILDHITDLFRTEDQQLRHKMASFFESLIQSFHYTDILLVDLQGRVHFGLQHTGAQLEAELQSTLNKSLSEKKAILSELYFCEQHDKPCLDVVAPIFAPESEQQEVIGFVVLRNHAETLLYPLIQSWPGKSSSAETLLVRKDGENALFLNELRHQQNTALRLSIPLTKKDIPAVQAVLGKRGTFEGIDYRGVPILSVVSAVPGTSWLMVAKIDSSEAFADWQSRSLLILAGTFCLCATLLAVIGMVWQRYAKKHYQDALRAETLRRQAEEQYRIILMSVGDGVIVCNKYGRINMLNPVAERLTGWTQDEALGRTIEEVFVIVNEDSRKTVENPVSRVLAEGLVVGLANHTLLITPDGREFPIADSGAPVFDDEKNIIGVVLVFRDQTEERRAESALRHSNQLLMRAEEMANMGCWQFDLTERTFWASDSAKKIYGLDQKSQLIADVQKIPLPEYRERLDQAIKDLIEDGNEYDIEFRIQRPTDNAVLDIHSRAEYTAQDNRIFGLIQDITSKKLAEEQLQESQSRYFSLFHNNHAVMLLIDPETEQVVDANPAAVAFYGWSHDELVGKKIYEINTLSRDQLKREMEKVILNNKDYFQFTHRLADGSRRDVEIFTGAIRISGKNCLYSIVHDITDRKIAEEQRQHLQEQLMQAQKLESVGLLAGGIAHDLNNLLSPILGYSDLLLLDLAEDDSRKEYVQSISQAGIRARELVHQLLAFGRKQTLVMETVELNHLIATFIQLLRRTVREDIQITTEFCKNSCVVRVDTGQIEQVIMNLLVNAQDAMPDGGKIILETAKVALDDDYARIHTDVVPGKFVMMAITDTGSGMSEDTRQQIFSPFFTTKKKGKGTGLGLATVYGIVKQHGGHIWVYSEPDQGTTFKVYLPAVEEKAAVVPAAEKKQEQDAPSGSEMIMVVEDNEMVRQMTVDILVRRGYEVLSAAGGDECLAKIKEHSRPIELLVTDVVMPEMNGKELYKKAQKLLPSLKVLYMSGYTENVIAYRGVLEDGVNFIQKPFNPAGLAIKVREALDAVVASEEQEK